MHKTLLLASLMLVSVCQAYTSTELLASCLYLEAGGEGFMGMELVACVIQNRANRDGKPLSEVITKPSQFSCFNLGIVIKYNDDAYMLAKQVEKNGIQDITGGSYFYQRKELPKRKWHGEKVLTYKNHSFYLKK